MTAARTLATASASALPEHVRVAFGVRDIEPRPVVWAGQRAWQCGEVLLRPVADHVVAAWSATVMENLEVDGVRLARPVRSSDGRWVVGGWAASRYVPGAPEPRHDEVVSASLRLHAATSTVLRPRLLDDRDDLLSRSAAAAFGEHKLDLHPETGGALFSELAAYRRTVRLTPQVVHGELFGAMLFDPQGRPAVLDLVPFWRPAEWAAAVVVVDAVAWGGADDDLLERWSDLAEWPQSLLRAVLYRLALHAQHPDATHESMTGIARVAELVGRRL
ncbi:TIGR02569 family protein [Pseudonocardia nematodicida]|uniref:TIGR02569 family protein n=1 Tax=Pseudonocardia nematodicida TaxID=1206997 RepID=A0ABV1KAK7_9PSEU